MLILKKREGNAKDFFDCLRIPSLQSKHPIRTKLVYLLLPRVNRGPRYVPFSRLTLTTLWSPPSLNSCCTRSLQDDLTRSYTLLRTLTWLFYIWPSCLPKPTTRHSMIRPILDAFAGPSALTQVLDWCFWTAQMTIFEVKFKLFFRKYFCVFCIGWLEVFVVALFCRVAVKTKTVCW